MAKKNSILRYIMAGIAETEIPNVSFTQTRTNHHLASTYLKIQLIVLLNRRNSRSKSAFSQ